MTSILGARQVENCSTACFAREVAPLLDVLSRRARRLTRNDADADDLLQDALLHAFKGFHTFQEGSNLKAWLFKILYHRWVTTHRAMQCRPSEVSADNVPEARFADGVARAQTAGRSAEAEVLESWPQGEVEQALKALPLGFAAAVYYTDVQGYTYAETAAILDIPVGTVMSRSSRARQRLRIALAHLAPDRRDWSSTERRSA